VWEERKEKKWIVVLCDGLRIGELLGTTGTLKEEQIFDGEQAHETCMLFQWNYWEAKRCGSQSIFCRAFLPACGVLIL
jgi:hypothetical protein